MGTKPKHSKLLSLKEWLTLEHAAKRLSLLLDEEVTVPDVLRLALDGLLTLSVRLVNGAQARTGRLVPLSECKVSILPSLNRDQDAALPPLPENPLTYQELLSNYPTIKEHVEAGNIIIFPVAIPATDEQWIVQEETVTTIEGIWDLPMIGAERLDIEHHYQMEVGGPEITWLSLDGAFVKRDGVYAQLLEDFEENEHARGSRANLEAIERHIADSKIGGESAEKLLVDYRAARKEFLESRRQCHPSTRYYPAALPQDAVCVVRSSALHEFERSLLTGESDGGKPLASRERAALLNIIGALLSVISQGIPNGKRQGGRIGPVDGWSSEAQLITALDAQFEGFDGLSKRNLEQKFGAAKGGLKES